MKKILSFLVLISLSASTMAQLTPGYGQCGGIGGPSPTPTSCVDGFTCTYINEFYSQCLPGGANGHRYAAALIAPPGDVWAGFNAGQRVTLTATNNNILGCFVDIVPNYGTSWSGLVLPSSPKVLVYTVFATLPVGWRFEASTNADSALVSLVFTWS
jgi:cellulose 1,4-beta-cellobiosidase